MHAMKTMTKEREQLKPFVLCRSKTNQPSQQQTHRIMNHIEISLQSLVDQAKLAGEVLTEHIKGVILQRDRGALDSSCTTGSPALHVVLVAAAPLLRQGVEGHRQLVVVDPPPRFARLFGQGRFDRGGRGGHGRDSALLVLLEVVWVVSVLRIFVLGFFVCGVQRGIHLLLGHCLVGVWGQ